jgi:hypothetical protein
MNSVVYIEIHSKICNNETMPDKEFERRKQEYGPREQALTKAMAVVFFNGDEHAAWQAVFDVAERDQRFYETPLHVQPTTRLHLKATHQ